MSVMVSESGGTSRAEGPARNGTELRLADLARRRRRPLLVMIDEKGQTLASSVRDDTLSAEGELLLPVLGEARRLISQVIDGIPQSCSLVLVDERFYSVRLFPVWLRESDKPQRQYAVLIEPVVEGQAESVDFARLKETYRLSRREMDVLAALMSGSTDKEIAREIGVSASTARAYLKSIRAKLGVTTRTAVVNLVHRFSAG